MDQKLKPTDLAVQTANTTDGTTTDEGEVLQDPLIDDLTTLAEPEVTERPDEPPPGLPAFDGEDVGPSDDPDEPAEPPHHVEMAEAAKTDLESEPGTIGDKYDRARELEEGASARLEPGIAMTISFGALMEGQLDANLRIAPNDTNRTLEIPVIPDGMSTAAIPYMEAARAVIGGRRAKRKGKLENNKPLMFLVELSEAPKSVRTEVITLLGIEIQVLFEKARLQNLWKEPTYADAVALLVQDIPPSVSRKLIVDILSVNPLGLDFGVDRWEARFAWELVNGLPAAERAALLEDQVVGDTREDQNDHHEVATKLGRVQPNISEEYRESTRYDAFDGNSRGDEVAEGTAGADTARESLLMTIQSSETWADGNGSLLRATLRMILQAGDAALVKSEVKNHWTSHGQLLRTLGFQQDGTWVEDIQDETATTWLSRTMAGLGTLWQVIKVMALSDDLEEIDLEQVETGFLSAYAGVRLEEIEGDAAEGVVDTVLAGVGGYNALAFLFRGVPKSEFLGLISSGAFIEDKLNEYIQAAPTADALAAGEEVDGTVGKMVLAENDREGTTVIGIPLLPIAGIATMSGTSTYKTGATTVRDLSITIKRPTAHDGASGITFKVGQLVLGDLMIVTPQGMTTIDAIVVNNLEMDGEGSAKEPASLASRVFADIQRNLLQILQIIPFNNIALAAGTVETLQEGLQTYQAVTSMSGGDFRQMSLSFGGMGIVGLHTSDGTSIDTITVDGGELKLDRPALLELDGLTTDQLIGRFHEIADHKAEAEERLRKLASRGKEDGRRADVLREQIAWCTAALTEVQDRMLVQDKINPLQARIESLQDERAAREKELRKQQRKESRKAGDSGAEKRWRRDRLIAEDPRIKQIDTQVFELQTQVQLLLGADVEGGIGEINVTGVETSSGSIGSVHISDVEVNGGMHTGDGDIRSTDALGGNDTGMTIESGFILVDDVKMADGERRDLVLGSAISAAREEIKETRKRSTERQTEAGVAADDQSLGDAEAEAIRVLEENIRLAELELESLQPLVDEYAILRGFLTDPTHEMTDGDRTRLQQVRAQLNSPPTTQMDYLVLSQVKLTLGLSGAAAADYGLAENDDNGERMLALARSTDVSLEVGTVAAGGITLADDGYAIDKNEEGAGDDAVSAMDGGETRISSVVSTGASMRLDGNAGVDGLLNLQAPDTDITGISIDGNMAIATRRREQLATEIAQIDERLGQLGSSPDDERQREALTTRKSWLEGQLTEVQAVVDSPEKLQEFLDQYPTLSTGLTSIGDIDCKTGFTLVGATDAIRTLDIEIGKLRRGEKGQLGESSIQQANLLIPQYTEGVAALEAELAALGPVPMSGGETTLAERRDDAFAARDRSEIVSLLASARAELDMWTGTLEDLRRAEGQLLAKRADYDRMKDILDNLIAEAGNHGVDPCALDIETPWEKLSADTVRRIAKGQLDGLQTMTVGSVEMNGLDADISGVLATLQNTDPDTGAYSSILQLSPGTAGGEGNNILDELTVTDVKLGEETMISELNLSDLAGTISIYSGTHFGIEGLSIGSLVMDSLHWHSPDYGIDADGALELGGLVVDADIHLEGEDYVGTIEKVVIDDISGPSMKVTYGDYVFTFGSLSAGLEGPDEQASPEGKLNAVEVTDMDLSTFAFDSVNLGGLKTTELTADLTGGMKMNAATFDAGNISIGSVLTPEARADQERKGEDPFANAYSIDMTGVSADELAVEMEGMGIMMDKVEGANLTGMTIDLHTGAFAIDALDVDTLNMGPVSYVTDQMKVYVHTGIAVSGAHVDIEGELDFDEDQADADREAGKVPEFIKKMIINVEADSATLRDLEYWADGANSDQTIRLQQAQASNFRIDGYNMNTGAMDVGADNVAVDGLKMWMNSTLSEQTITGDFDLDSFSMDLEADGDMGVDFSGVSSDGMTYTSADETRDGEDNAVNAMTNVMIGGMTGVSGSVAMDGTAWDEARGGEGGAVTSFSNVKLGTLDIGNLNWSADAGSVSSVVATGATVHDVELNGTSTTRMVQKRGMWLPANDLSITSLTVGGVAADTLALDGQAVSQDGEGGERTTETNIGGKAIWLDTLSVTGLESIDGEFTGGHIEISDVGANGTFDSSVIAGKFAPMLKGSAGLHASGISVDLLGNGMTMARISGLDVTNAVFDVQLDEPGSSLSVRAPYIQINDVAVLNQSADDDDTLFDMTNANIGNVVLLDDASFEYTAADLTETNYRENEKSSSERLAEAARYGEGGDLREGAMEAHKDIQALNLDGLLETLSGTVHADIHDDTILTDGPIPLSIVIQNGEVVFVLLGSSQEAIVNSAIASVFMRWYGVELETYDSEIKDLIAAHPDKIQADAVEATWDDIKGEESWGSWILRNAGPIPIPPDLAGLMEKYDEGALEKRSDRDQAVEAWESMEAFAEENGLDWFAGVANDISQRMRDPLTEENYINVWLENLRTELTLGPWSSQIGDAEVDDGGAVTRKRIELGATSINFRDTDKKGNYLADVDLESAAFGSVTQDGESVEWMGASATGIDLNARLTQLLPKGKIEVPYAGSSGEDTLTNPITGSLLRDTQIDNIKIRMGSLYEK